MTINIGDTIKSMRKNKNITQETLANFLGVSNQSISKWERNETYPDIAMLPAIASFFGTSVDNLLGINKIEQERKIQHYCNEYSRLWSEHKPEDVTALMKQAVCEFPGNFDLLVIIEGKSLKDVANFVATRLSTIEGVTQTRSHFMLKAYKKDGVIMEDDDSDRRLVVAP